MNSEPTLRLLLLLGLLSPVIHRGYNQLIMRLARIGSFLLLLTASAMAQQFVVNVIDGRNGHPMKNQVVDIWFGNRATGIPLQVRTGQDATAVVTIPHDAQTFVAAGEWVADCRAGNKPGRSFTDSYVYQIPTVLNSGTVSENRCGKATTKPIPGIFTFFVRPLRWWEKMRE